MTRRVFQTFYFLLLLVFLPFPSLSAQEEDAPELTETEKQRLAEEAHLDTGIELYYQYNLPYHIPGWAYSSRDYDIGPFDVTMPGINISYINICLGADMDFGSSKKYLKDMGFGVALEWNILDSWNMDGYDATLFQFQTYLFYNEKTKRFIDYYYKFGLGIANISNRDIFDTQQERDSPTGALILLEMGSVYPSIGPFRFMSGISYKFISMNTKNVHLLAPYVRGGYSF